jgi:hypothetical protein
MVYVIDKKAKSTDRQYTDFDFRDVLSDKKALWHSKEDASFGVCCFIKDNHAGDPEYTMDRYEYKDE